VSASSNSARGKVAGSSSELRIASDVSVSASSILRLWALGSTLGMTLSQEACTGKVIEKSPDSEIDAGDG
jgi:hypothetical protein